MGGGIILEFATLVMPMLLVQTSLLPDIIGPLGLLVGMAMLALLIPLRSNPSARQQHHGADQQRSLEGKEPHHRHRPAFLSIHRACVYLLTTIAILAVDFPLFPRRYCKTEVSGYGWMDLGAASFIIIAGWSSALSDSTTTATTRNNKDALVNGQPRNMTTSGRRLATKAIMKCGPLLMIGFIRLATNKGLEYQEHVSEYGVHWNFFFTLSIVEGSMVVWKGLKGQFSSTNTNQFLPFDFILAMLIMVTYQWFLTNHGGQDFIVDGSRICNTQTYGDFLPGWLIIDHPVLCNIFVANREGILGVFGYFSLRLFSEAISRRVLLPMQESFDHRDKQELLCHHRLFFMSVSLWMIHIGMTAGLNIPTSRRSTNSSFILWALSHNMTLLSLIYKVTARTTSAESEMKRLHPLLEAVNRFGLAVFLSSNILTGLVNLTFDTLHTSDRMAMIILTAYLMMVCGFALFLDDVKSKNADATLKSLARF